MGEGEDRSKVKDEKGRGGDVAVDRRWWARGRTWGGRTTLVVLAGVGGKDRRRVCVRSVGSRRGGW